MTAVASGLLVAAATIGLYQILARFVFEQPSRWSTVLAQTCIIWMVFLGLASALRQGALLSVDLALRLSPAPLRKALALLIALCCLVLLVIMVWHGTQMAWRVRYQTLAGLDISIAWAYAAIPVGASFGLVAMVARWLDPPA